MRLKVFAKGQVVIPAFFRKKHNIRQGDIIDIYEKDSQLVIDVQNRSSHPKDLFGTLKPYAEATAQQDLTHQHIADITAENLIEGWSKKDELD